MKSISIQVASAKHEKYVDSICKMIEDSAKQRGTGIARRPPEYIRQKMQEHKAIIALEKDQLAGFCYIESWSNKQYVVNSGLIVLPEYRGSGLAKRIKKRAFDQSRKMFPGAKLFGLTTSLPVMKINSELGYHPVTYNQLTTDELFWDGCKSCVNYEILLSKNRNNCMCTAMLHDPNRKKEKRWNFIKKSKLYARFMKLKKRRLERKGVVA